MIVREWLKIRLKHVKPQNAYNLGDVESARYTLLLQNIDNGLDHKNPTFLYKKNSAQKSTHKKYYLRTLGTAVVDRASTSSNWGGSKIFLNKGGVDKQGLVFWF